jgi:hypothetical protein
MVVCWHDWWYVGLLVCRHFGMLVRVADPNTLSTDWQVWHTPVTSSTTVTTEGTLDDCGLTVLQFAEKHNLPSVDMLRDFQY